MIKFGMILMIICIAASLVLVLVYNLTEPVIAAQAKQEEYSALKEAFTKAGEFRETAVGDTRYFEAYKGGKLIGYVLEVRPKGYADTIHMFVGINIDGIIEGVKIVSQNETPGLGAQITAVKYGEKEPFFTKQFKGKKKEDLSLKNIQAITGATVSSKAVIDGARRAIDEFISNLQ